MNLNFNIKKYLWTQPGSLVEWTGFPVPLGDGMAAGTVSPGTEKRAGTSGWPVTGSLTHT